jgi:hypothetical protein
MRRLLHILVFTLSLSSLGKGAGAAPSLMESRATFESANQTYLRGDFAVARDIYLELLEQWPNDAVLYYNLGNTQMQLDEPGWAVWCYEMALLLRPGWREDTHNLRLAQPTDPAPANFLDRAIHWARDDVAPWRWSWLAVLMWALTLSAASGALLIERPALSRGLWRLTGFSALLMVVALASLMVQRGERQTSPPSIVVEGDTQVRSGPGEEAGSIMGSLPAGTRVWQVSAPLATGWVKVQMGDGPVGFVDQAALRELKL